MELSSLIYHKSNAQDQDNAFSPTAPPFIFSDIIRIIFFCLSSSYTQKLVDQKKLTQKQMAKIKSIPLTASQILLHRLIAKLISLPLLEYLQALLSPLIINTT